MRIFVSADNSTIIMDPEAAERVLYHVDLAYNELCEDNEIDENCVLGSLLRHCLRQIDQGGA